MPTHMNLRWTEMEDALAGTEKLKKLAKAYGIVDPFSDNGVKVLQIAVATGLDIMPGRLGPDAVDRIGNEYEIKTVDLDKKNSGFSTNHHLNNAVIDRFTSRRFVFATYQGSTLVEAYLVESHQLRAIFAKWRRDLKGRTHLNNPKIPIETVRELGVPMYLKDVAPTWAVTETTTEDLLVA